MKFKDGSAAKSSCSLGPLVRKELKGLPPLVGILDAKGAKGTIWSFNGTGSGLASREVTYVWLSEHSASLVLDGKVVSVGKLEELLKDGSTVITFGKAVVLGGGPPRASSTPGADVPITTTRLQALPAGGNVDINTGGNVAGSNAVSMTTPMHSFLQDVSTPDSDGVGTTGNADEVMHGFAMLDGDPSDSQPAQPEFRGRGICAGMNGEPSGSTGATGSTTNDNLIYNLFDSWRSDGNNETHVGATLLPAVCHDADVYAREAEAFGFDQALQQLNSPSFRDDHLIDEEVDVSDIFVLSRAVRRGILVHEF